MRLFFLITGLLFSIGCRKPIDNSVNKQGPVTESTLRKEPDDEISTDFSIRVCCESSLNERDWRSYLESNLVLDSFEIEAIPPGIYTAVINFQIETDGRIVYAFIESDPGYGLAGTAVKVFQKYKAIAAEPGCLKTYRRQSITWTVEEQCRLPNT